MYFSFLKNVLFVLAIINGPITTIGENAFNGCTGLTSVTIPNTVTTIGICAFQNCTNLTSITIPNSVTTIGQAAFSRCGLTSITIPNSVTQIGRWAFEFCSNLQNINLPSSIKSIDVGTFQWAGLTSITIPASVGRIENFAFAACPLEYVACMSETPPALGNEATFPNAEKALVYVPSQDAVAAYKNSDWSKYFTNIIIIKTITYTATAKLPGYKGSLDVGSTTFGPAIISHTFSNGVGTIACAGEITQIGNISPAYSQEPFRACSDLKSITIPNSVTTIGFCAFYESGLTSIEIPSSVTALGEYAFMHCRSLSSVTIPNSIKILPMSTFYDCTSLKSIEIPSSVTTIGHSAFYESGLTSITISNTVRMIEETAFRNCNNLKTMYCYGFTPPSLGSDVFANVPQDISVYVLDIKAYKNGWGAQLPASCFKQITISAEVDGIKYELFGENFIHKARVVAKEGGYTGNVVIPEQITYQGMNFAVTEIGICAFQNCTNLTSITIPNSVTTIGQAAFSRCGLTSITIPNSVTQIGKWAFEYCNNLQNIDIPSSIKSIDVGTFQGAGLTSIAIPASVERIEGWAFQVCPNLKYIISMAETPPILAEEVFKGHDKDDKVIVYVPTSDAVIMYKNSNWGKYFTNFYSDITYRITSSSTAELVSAIPVDGKVYVPAVVTLDGNLYNVAGIGNDAFNYSDKDNEDLQSISLPPTMQYIGDSAFNRCVKLTQIELPVELQTIGEKAFYGCTSLGSIVIPEGVQSIGNGAFMECRSLKYVSLPESLRTIPDECFRHCLLGREIVVPEGVETIGVYGFEAGSDTKIETVITLPSTLKEINYGAFFWRNGLKDVTCLATTPPTLKGQVFAEYKDQKYKDEQITVYVPDRDVMAKYRDDKDQWGSDLYKFKFTDLMAEENKEYLRTLAGSNDTAKAIANAYCDSIDNRATTTQQVQDYTNTAAMMMDKYVFPDYKVRLCKELDNIASTVLNAQPIADDYKQRIMDTHFRGEAENLFAEGCAKIDALKQLYDLKEKCGKALRDMAQGYSGAEGIAEFYAGLIDGAATQAEVYQLYEEGKKRVAKALFTGKYWIDLGGCYVLGGFIEEK